MELSRWAIGSMLFRSPSSRRPRRYVMQQNFRSLRPMSDAMSATYASRSFYQFRPLSSLYSAKPEHKNGLDTRSANVKIFALHFSGGSM